MYGCSGRRANAGQPFLEFLPRIDDVNVGAKLRVKLVRLVARRLASLAAYDPRMPLISLPSTHQRPRRPAKECRDGAVGGALPSTLERIENLVHPFVRHGVLLRSGYRCAALVEGARVSAADVIRRVRAGSNSRAMRMFQSEVFHPGRRGGSLPHRIPATGEVQDRDCGGEDEVQQAQAPSVTRWHGRRVEWMVAEQPRVDRTFADQRYHDRESMNERDVQQVVEEWHAAERRHK